MVRRQLFRGLAASTIGALCLSAFLAAASNAPVADAAQQGNKDAVKALLKQATDVNAAQGDGMTALHWAAMNGDAAMVEMLVYAGANVRATTRIGSYTPLYLASQRGSGAAIGALIKAGADVKASTPNGTTPLMVAAASGEVSAIKALLDGGADANAKDSVRGQTALMYAAASNRSEAIKVLASRGANIKATSKVTDLSALTREGLGFGGNPQIPGGQGQGGPAQAAPGGPGGRPAAGAPGGPGARPQPRPGIDRQYQLNELVSAQGGLTPLLYAVRQGFVESTTALIESGADVNQVCAGDQTSPLMMAVINGHFDLAQLLLEKGANPNLASDNGATPLYAALNVEWAPKALYPQPRAYQQQKISYLELMNSLLAKGADPNARLKKKVWYSGYSFDLSGVDEIGASVFWRAAYASDVAAMRLLVGHGADPNLPTIKPAGRPRFGDAFEREVKDVSGLPEMIIGGPSVTPLQAAAGVGYGEGFAANSHRFAPTGMMAAVKYLVEELGADVNAADHEGNTALHHAAARGDNEMILYLVSRGANVKAVDREGRTTADMANGAVQRVQPYPETIALLEKLGSKNNHKCVSC